MGLIRKYLLLLMLPLTLELFAQDVDPQIVLERAHNKIQDIGSYTADALIHVDINFLEMPDKKAKVSYAYPNKLKIDVKGFSIIPKYGMRPLMKTIAKEDNMAIFSGREEVDGHTCFVVKLLPRDDGKIIMMKLWIDSIDYLVRRSETFTRHSGNFLIEMEYGDLVLPSSMLFVFESKEISLPMKFLGGSIEIDKSKTNNDGANYGKVLISFSNYEIEYSE
jgi:hypothetical protein